MIPFLIALLGVGAGLAFILIRGRIQERRRVDARAMLLQVAQRLKLPERLAGGESIRFQRGGFPAAMSVHVGARLNVEVSFQLTVEERGWLSISSLGLKRAFLEQIGFADFQVGEARFDDRFEVWGRDEDYVRNKVGADLRELLYQMDRRWDLLVRMTPDQLTVRAHIDPVDRFQVESLAGLAFQILDLLDLKSARDFVLTQVHEKLGEDTRCPVCGSPLSRGAVVRCAKCRSAHHVDCWQFNGLCATFACGSQKHVR